uniref:uncharacterized protein LOC122610233 n=1 Tax=Erigeron canadensis TaxID=72917 RepID=UPI001CB9706A|nr:uncharacterized protein LOC122610233 [Erigeron canadensis]
MDDDNLNGYEEYGYVLNNDSESNVTQSSKLNLSSPLHLHPNDSSTLSVVSIKLKGTENYQIWSCAMILALEAKNKIGFVEGTCRRSNTNEVLGKQWDRCNAVVLFWILNSINEELYLGQIFSRKASLVWKELKETYDKVDGYVIFNLHHKINSLCQNGMPLSDYYHKLNALWKQFDALVQLPRCTCHAASDFAKHTQLMKFMQFLMGLDDMYVNVRSTILTKKPLPDLKTAYSILSRDESHRGLSSAPSQKSQSSAFLSTVNQTRKVSSGNTFNNKYKCFKKLTKSGWISDSGANHHITFSEDNLVDVLDISALKIKVGHPNGTSAYIKKIGNLQVTDYLTLFDVLVVPEYCVQLLSGLKAMKVLGTGKQSGGLYYIDECVEGINRLVTCNVSQLTWHNRLGHPAESVMNKLHFELQIKHDSKFACDNCFHAKRTRNIFYKSDHHSKKIGELVHLDVWGPYRITLRGGFRLPSTVLNGKSPYEMFSNKKPDLSHLRSFGCLCYSKNLNTFDKFASRSTKSVLIRYLSTKKGYKLLSLEDIKIFFARDVKFFENVFPLNAKFLNKTSGSQVELVSNEDQLNFYESFEHPQSSNDEVRETTDIGDGSNHSHVDNVHRNSMNENLDAATHDENDNRSEENLIINNEDMIEDVINDELVANEQQNEVF